MGLVGFVEFFGFIEFVGLIWFISFVSFIWLFLKAGGEEAVRYFGVQASQLIAVDD